MVEKQSWRLVYQEDRVDLGEKVWAGRKQSLESEMSTSTSNRMGQGKLLGRVLRKEAAQDQAPEHQLDHWHERPGPDSTGRPAP
jgi:UTP:GlnB (protein PII) uridylyltransferase